ncbi:unnamed protein product [Linum trigynum]|uniref:Uncharacterized protein n=1 Tax=Linum trigynum TaxID=586398 RepID=A0AAV2E4N9_9ROSI
MGEESGWFLHLGISRDKQRSSFLLTCCTSTKSSSGTSGGRWCLEISSSFACSSFWIDLTTTTAASTSSMEGLGWRSERSTISNQSGKREESEETTDDKDKATPLVKTR